MPVNKEAYYRLKSELDKKSVTLVAVSKTKPAEEVMDLYELGQRDFGENYVQELLDKAALLPKDIRWHFIGHLQRNKVKYIIPFVHLIQGVDSPRLLEEINKQALKLGTICNCLLQMHIASEETKFGFAENELSEFLEELSLKMQLNQLGNVKIRGLMGMASLTDEPEMSRMEFKTLKQVFDKFSKKEDPSLHLDILSMGMSGDYQLAIEEGSNMVRIGSLLFGERE